MRPPSLLLLLLLILLEGLASPARAWQDLRRCCAPGEVLVASLSCAPAPRPLRDSLVHAPEGEPTPGLPNCGRGRYPVASLLQDVVLLGAFGPACLDVYWDSRSHLDFPVVVRCSERPRFSMRQGFTDLDESVGSARRRIAFRKCCPGDGSYSPERGHCVPGSSVADFRPLFERLPEVDLLHVYDGPPRCEHALLDFAVRLDQVYAREGRVTVSIPWMGARRNVTVETDNGCLDLTDGLLAARVCSGPDYCLTNPCLRKCCPENRINSRCQDEEPSGLRSFRAGLVELALPAFDVKSYGLLVGKLCKYSYPLEPGEHWTIDESGTLSVPPYEPYGLSSYCLEYMRNDSRNEDGIAVSICADDDTWNGPTPNELKMQASLELISCTFLVVTLLVYVCLPSLQNLHGKTLMCHIISLLFAYAGLATDILFTLRFLVNEQDDGTTDALCVLLGYIVEFSFYSTFFWLNVMCFDIWWTFGGVRRSAESKRRAQKKRFLCYCLYAWGLALFLTSLTLLLDRLGLPAFSTMGQRRCWFDYTTSAEVYIFYVPISVTLLTNVVFFITTARRCSKVKAEIKRVTANAKDPTARKFHSDRSRLIMNAKLFVVMGIPWLLENVSGYVEHFTWLHELFYVSDVVNCLQGVWIFILFVLKAKVYRALRRRFPWVQRRVNKTSGSSSNALTVRHQGPGFSSSGSSGTLATNFLASSSAS